MNERKVRKLIREELCALGYGKRVELKPDAAPVSSAGPQNFHNRPNDNTYQGLPVEFFDVGRREVRLKPEIAQKIEWAVDEELADSYNINAPAQSITVAGTTYSIEPGFFCSYIPKSKTR
jgi:hypothetical protein